MVHCAYPTSSDFTASTQGSRFEIHAEGCPQVLARIVGLFGRLALLPADLHARRSCGGLWIGVQIDVDMPTGERIAEKLRATVGIDGVVFIPPPAEAPEPHRPAGAPESFARLIETGGCPRGLSSEFHRNSMDRTSIALGILNINPA